MWMPRKQTDQAYQTDLLTFWDSGRLFKIAQAVSYKSRLNLVSLLHTHTQYIFIKQTNKQNRARTDHVFIKSPAIQDKRKTMSKDIRRITTFHCPYGVQHLEARRMHATRESTQVIPSITGACSAHYCTGCLQV